MLHFEDVTIKCPKQYLYYIEFVCKRTHGKNSSLIFYVFGWLPGLQNLDFFGKFTAEQVLKPFAGRDNSLKLTVFGFCDSLLFGVEESGELRALIRWVLE